MSQEHFGSQRSHLKELDVQRSQLEQCNTHKSRLEHLLSTMNYPGEKLLDRMNIQSDILIINQVDNPQDCKYQECWYDGAQVRILSLYERGIGLSRNTALARATGDYLIISDDDVCYNPDYPEVIQNAFEAQPDADLIMFRVDRMGNAQRKAPMQKAGIKRIRCNRILRFGAVNIVVKRKRVIDKGVQFDYSFGTKEFPGEDTLFTVECHKAGLRLYSCDQSIGVVDLSGSSWFEGYDGSYLETRGALFYRLSKPLFSPLCLQYALRKRGTEFPDMTVSTMLKHMRTGRAKVMEREG